VRLRTRVTKGPGSRAAGLAMAFKLLQAAQDRWRAVNGPHLVALVRAGTTFHKGQIVERPADITKKSAKTAPKKTPSTAAPGAQLARVDAAHDIGRQVATG
jgi:hypothetical protein